jgi:glycerol 3-phosphatase-2
VLKDADRPLWEVYDLAMLDLDGVVYVGPEAVPGAADHLNAAREAGMQLAYVTNNASRPPEAVAAHLRDLGIHVADDEVVTSAQAASRLLAQELPEGAPVFVIGGRGLEVALAEQGLRAVHDRAEEPAAVVSGFAPELRWETVITGAILVKEGLPWVASNTDATVPTAHGPGPGNGALVDLVARFAGREPVVAGKPEPPLMQETRLRTGGERPLVVGDRLDTDIAGARRSGYDSLLVMTGVTDLAQLVAAEQGQRPSYVASGLGALGAAQPAPETKDGEVSCEGWRAEVVSGTLEVSGDGPADAWWRVVATAGWTHHDDTGSVADVSGLSVPVA